MRRGVQGGAVPLGVGGRLRLHHHHRLRVCQVGRRSGGKETCHHFYRSRPSSMGAKVAEATEYSVLLLMNELLQ